MPLATGTIRSSDRLQHSKQNSLSQEEDVVQPLILDYAVRGGCARFCDDLSGDDPLPSIVYTDAAGIATDQTTRVTEVHQETTDDK